MSENYRLYYDVNQVCYIYIILFAIKNYEPHEIALETQYILLNVSQMSNLFILLLTQTDFFDPYSIK